MTNMPAPALEPSPLPIRTATRTIRLQGTLARGAAIVTAASAAGVLIGWATDTQLLKSLLHPADIAMNPVTAVGFILSALALWLLLKHPVSTTRRRASTLLAGAALAIGLLKLASLFGLPISVDTLLFASKLGKNVMAPNSAIAMALISCSLLLIDRRLPWIRPTPWLALATLGLSLLALLGYAYGISPLYKFHGFIAMALNSAICFYILAAGVVAARPEHPPISTILSDSVGGLISRRLLPAAILMPAFVGYAALSIARQDRLGSELAVLLFTLTTIIVFVALTAWIAGRLHRLDLENRQTLRQLQRAEAVYHSLVQTLPQNVFRKNREGVFTFGNRHFCQTLGRTLDQIVGRTDFDFYGPELAGRYREDDIAVAKEGKTTDMVEEHVTPNGDRLYVQVMKTPVRAVDGQVMGVQGIFWDVTDRVVAQQELEKKNLALLEANTALEHAVAAERAAMDQLTRTQTHLVQSEKMVGLGQMVAGVAHEINNPLAFVINNVAVLQRDIKSLGAMIDLYRRLDDELRRLQPQLAAEIDELATAIDLDYTRQNIDELLVRSREGLRRIQQIVRDLRDFVRLDESELQEVDLNDGVRSTINIILGHAKKKQISIETELGSLPPVACYPAKINQVIMNLVGNAIDATPEHGRVLVRTVAVGNPPEHVVLEVIDNGSGIDPEIQRRIFDPFFTTKPVGQGTGLGLSISYGIIRDHKGKIEVESEVGKGTTFRVTLPTQTAKAEESAAGKRDT